MTPATSPVPEPPQESRLASPRRRAAVAKTALGGGGVLLFALAAVAARAQFPGHSKRPVRALAPPPRFVRTVRDSFLQAGLLAPTQAPPDAVTSVS